MTISDLSLWKSIVTSDDERAFATLYDRHWKRLYRTALYYSGDPTIAQQLLHDVFVTLWEKRKSLVIENFGNYLLVATRYQVYSHQRKSKKAWINYIEDYATAPEPSVENEALTNLYHQDFYDLMEKHLNILPKRCKEIFWMSRVNHLSNEEIAKKLGISKRTVENQITAALKFLKEYRVPLEHSLLSMVLISLGIFS